jgi:methyl-accepting chemotaxis protein
MRRLRNLPIGSRLGLAFGLVLAVLLLVVGVAIERMTQIKQRVDVIVDENNQKTALVNTMIASVLTQAVSLRTVLFETMEEEVQRQVGRIGQDRNKYEAALAKLVPLVHTAKEAELVAVLGEIRLKANKVIDKALQLGLAGRQQEAAVFVNRGAAPQRKHGWRRYRASATFKKL